MNFLSKNELFVIFNNENVIVWFFIHSIFDFNDNYSMIFLLRLCKNHFKSLHKCKVFKTSALHQ